MGDNNEKKVNAEIEEMLTALGDPTPESLIDDEEEDLEEVETPEEKAARELKESEEANLSDEEKTAKKKEEEEAKAEAERLAEEKKKKGETEEQKKEREKKEAEANIPDKDKIIESLRKQVNDKSGTSLPKEKTKEEIEKEKVDEATRIKAKEEANKKVEPLKLEDQDFVGDLDLDELTRDKIVLNKLLNSVYAKGVNDSKNITIEGVLSTIPDIVKHNLTLLTSLKEASDNFYNENKDLVPFKRVVAEAFEDIAAKNPGKKYDELMNLVAPEARKRLEITKQAVKADKGKGDEKVKLPRLPGAKGGKHQAPLHKSNKSALENEISEMNTTLGR